MLTDHGSTMLTDHGATMLTDHAQRAGITYNLATTERRFQPFFFVSFVPLWCE